MALKTVPWDVTEHLDSEEAIAAYLDSAIEEGNPELFRAAILDVARARGMTAIAEKAGISRQGLYKALGEQGNPSFEVIEAVMKALGVRLSIRAAEAANDRGEHVAEKMRR